MVTDITATPIPFCGAHLLAADDFTSAAPPQGRLETISHFPPHGITLKKIGHLHVREGMYISPVHTLDTPATELVLTWNCSAPTSTALTVEFRVGTPSGNYEWSAWLQMGSWKSEVSRARRTSDIVYGELKTDHFIAARTFTQYQYRISFATLDPATVPYLRRVSIATSDTSAIDPAFPASTGWRTPPVSPCDIDVPWLSQYDIDTVRDSAMMQAGVCAATSLTMVLNHHGIPAKIRDIGLRAFDPVARIYGNWAFLCAAASEYGVNAHVERFSDWDSVAACLMRGIPVIISIAYPPNTFSAEPAKSSSGHLIVARGITDSHDIIVNDPGTTDPARGHAYIYPHAELARAFFGHGGVGIVVSPAGSQLIGGSTNA